MKIIKVSAISLAAILFVGACANQNDPLGTYRAGGFDGGD